MAEHKSVALPIVLRDAIVERSLEHETIKHASDRFVRAALTHAHARQARGQPLAALYLGDPRITSAFAATMVRLPMATYAAADALASVMRVELGRTFPTGRVIQALLWAVVAPLSDAERHLVPVSGGVERQSISIARPLYEALIAYATIMGQGRAITTTVDTLLAQILGSHSTRTVDRTTLQQAFAAHPIAERVSTIRYSRVFEPRLRQIAQDGFGGVKKHALQAVLWYALDHPGVALTEVLVGTVQINGSLYAKVRAAALAQNSTVHAFVEDAVADKLARVQHRKCA